MPLLLSFSAAAETNRPTFHSEALISVVETGKLRAVGLGVSVTNRLFLTFPGKITSDSPSLVEVVNGQLVPYPNTAWNTSSGDERKRFVSAQALYVDAQDNLWVLDSSPSNGPITEKKNEGYFKLVKINLETNTVERQYDFAGLDKTLSSLNDVNVDLGKKLAYLSDPGQRAIVVLDLNTGVARTVLRNSAATTAEAGMILRYDGQEMRNPNGIPFRSDVNGIALTKDNRYLYFKPINTLNLYRIETRYLADKSLSEPDLISNVENRGATAVSHGLAADAKNTIYLTSSLDYSIKYVAPDGGVQTLVQDSRLLWPDSLGIGSDGYLYLTAAQFQKSPYWNKGLDGTVYPYQVYKVRLAR